MKKIICICICICICIFLSSGCDKSLSHGRPANTVAEDKGSKAEPPLPSDTSNASALVPSNTPAPTPEPSKSALPSDSADTGSSVGKYAVNIGLFVVALIVIVGIYDVFRFFKPKIIRIPAPKVAGVISLPRDQINDGINNDGVYRYCHLRCNNDSSYTWYLAKRETRRYFFAGEHEKEIDSKISVYQLQNYFNLYVYKPAPSQ